MNNYRKYLKENRAEADELIASKEWFPALNKISENIAYYYISDLADHERLKFKEDMKVSALAAGNISNQDVIEFFKSKINYLNRLENLGCDCFEEYLQILTIASEILQLHIALKLNNIISKVEVSEIISTVGNAFDSFSHLESVEKYILKNNPLYIPINLFSEV
ncbi:MAG: hypothetical protein AAF228_13600 [Pseudomonadota bacterium]